MEIYSNVNRLVLKEYPGASSNQDVSSLGMDPGMYEFPTLLPISSDRATAVIKSWLHAPTRSAIVTQAGMT